MKKKKDRRKNKVKTKETIAVTVKKGTKDKILKISNNLSLFVDTAIDEYFKKLSSINLENR